MTKCSLYNLEELARVEFYENLYMERVELLIDVLLQIIYV